MDLSTQEIARIVGGEVHGPDVRVSVATIDSRSVAGGELFVPVVAERDGHDFVAAAVASGAAAYLTARGPLAGAGAGAGGTAVSVEDTVAALEALARDARRRIDGHVVGVTGSVGKTSVKDLLAGVLATRWVTSASVRSFNNELGVPLTVLNAPPGTEALVIEMGARGLGQIKALCDLAVPTVGLVTMVAAVHTELFGTVEDVAQAKGELVEALPDDGLAVLNSADPRVAAMAGRTTARVVRYGSGPGAVVRAEDVRVDAELRPSFRLVGDWGSGDVTLRGARGEHMVDNALAAAAVGLACGLDIDSVAAGLADAALSPWRMAVTRLPNGACVINDAYNANPTSVRAALRSLVAMGGGAGGAGGGGRRRAVLGLMAELGASAADDHRQVGDFARELGVEVISVEVEEYGGRVVPNDPAAVLEALGPLRDDDVVLLKASRVVGLEKVASALGA